LRQVEFSPVLRNVPGQNTCPAGDVAEKENKKHLESVNPPGVDNYNDLNALHEAAI